MTKDLQQTETAALQAARAPCTTQGFPTYEAADRMRVAPWKVYLCPLCYRFHLAKEIPHLAAEMGVKMA